ncbi:hypothetical protein, partial [Escherichia coli]|uniref:hypothetical protein n=1 Tax=Escherichia coli TaxID=562 RepID=UPI001AECF6FE
STALKALKECPLRPLSPGFIEADAHVVITAAIQHIVEQCACDGSDLLNILLWKCGKQRLFEAVRRKQEDDLINRDGHNCIAVMRLTLTIGRRLGEVHAHRLKNRPAGWSLHPHFTATPSPHLVPSPRDMRDLVCRLLLEKKKMNDRVKAGENYGGEMLA